MHRIALRQPLLGGLAAGKWDRFATFGEKVQEGQAFTFSVETFGQIVDNFARLFRGRRLGMDYEHQAANAPQNGKPAPQLAYYNALCVIEGGKPVKFYAQKPDVAEPDPALLLEQLRQRFPEYEDADGLWGYRCEHTPLGMELLPNYEQISPLFTSQGTDEQGQSVDYCLLNVSAVAVAFQDGTVFNLSKGAPAALSKQGAAMADQDKDKKPEGEGGNKLRSECMKKFGLPEDAADDAMYGAIMATKFADIVEEVEEKDEKEAKETDNPAMAADLPPAAMSKVLKRLDEEAAARRSAEERLAAVEKRERDAQVVAFRKGALSRLDSEKDADEWLADFGGDIAKATRALSRLPVRRTALSARMTADGAPLGSETDSSIASTIEDVNGVRVIGRGLSAMSQKLLSEGKAKTLGEAQILAAKQAPHLYTIR